MAQPGHPPIRRDTRDVADVVSAPDPLGRRQRPRAHHSAPRTGTRHARDAIRRWNRASSQAPPAPTGMRSSAARTSRGSAYFKGARLCGVHALETEPVDRDLRFPRRRDGLGVGAVTVASNGIAGTSLCAIERAASDENEAYRDGPCGAPPRLLRIVQTSSLDRGQRGACNANNATVTVRIVSLLLRLGERKSRRRRSAQCSHSSDHQRRARAPDSSAIPGGGGVSSVRAHWRSPSLPSGRLASAFMVPRA